MSSFFNFGNTCYEKKNEFTPEEFASFLLDYKQTGSEESEMIMAGISEERIEQIFEAIDTDHSGTINLAEFLECNAHFT